MNGTSRTRRLRGGRSIEKSRLAVGRIDGCMLDEVGGNRGNYQTPSAYREF